MKNQEGKNKEKESFERNSDWEGDDKAPGEEQGKAEKVTFRDLKGKKVDGDPEKENDQPAKEE